MTNPESFTEQRAKHSSDVHRPKYHFLAPTAWMNDPNGVIQWKGSYHLFYQHNPLEAKWGPPHWGHAVSTDLINWKDEAIALSPSDLPTDNEGCWSGCMVNNKGTATILYTGVKDGEQTTCIATGSPDLLTWHKHPENPIERLPQDLALSHQAYRDPFVWFENDVWLKVIGTSIDNTGQALVYESRDLINWTYLHPLVPQSAYALCEDSGNTWECPNFFALDNKHVLIVSRWLTEDLTYPIAFIGEFRDKQFYPEKRQELDSGSSCYYAPLSMQDEQQRRLIWGWLREQRAEEEQLRSGWSGVMSLPRVLNLDAHNNLIIKFPEELHALRDKKIEAQKSKANQETTFSCAQNNQAYELICNLDEAQTSIIFHYQNDKLELEFDGRSGKATCTFNNINKGIFTFNTQAKNQLRLFLDHSVLELVINQQTNFTSRQYPTGKLECISVSVCSDIVIWPLRTVLPHP